MSTGVDVFPHVELFSRRNCRRPSDQLNGPGGGLVPHVVRHRGLDHRVHIGPDVAEVMG